jgi:hypothetical protein
MEARLGHDFSAVQIHDDSRAAESAASVGAVAYTVGSHVVLGAGQQRVGSPGGDRLLAHELTHVIQQRNHAPIGNGITVEPSGSAAESAAQAVARGFAAATARDASHTDPKREESRLLQRLGVQDCGVNQTSQITAAVSNAGPAIQTTISKIGGTPPPAALTTYFGATGPQNAASIAGSLSTIASKLPGATAECEVPGSFMYDWFCGGNLAYVRPVPAFVGIGNIHVCQPQFERQTALQQRTTLIHEGAHRYDGAADEAYYTLGCQSTAQTIALSDAQRLNNADSYACLVEILG